MKKSIIVTILTFFAAASAADAQTDTTGVYGERADSLEAAVFVGKQQGNFLS